jgi:ferric-dicitrate binding protein FerR (iron transport regulator)
MKEQYIYLIHKSLSKTISNEEEEVLATWLKTAKSNEQIYEEVQQIWKISNELGKDIDQTYEPNTEQELAKIKQQIQQIETPQQSVAKTISLRIGNWLKIAATLLLMIAAWWLFNLNNTEWNHLLAENEVIRAVELPDGSKVWLNKEAEIKYPTVFQNNKREVTLKGEAYFEVTPHPKKPFFIKGQRTTIQVLGTKFNYRAVAKNGNLSTVEVLEGKVKFSVKDASATENVILTANQKGIYQANKTLIQEKTNALNAISWHTDKLTFEATTMLQACKQIERHYNVILNLEESNIKNCDLTADFEKDSLATVLETLALVYQLNIKKQKDNHYQLIGGFCQ